MPSAAIAATPDGVTMATTTPFIACVLQPAVTISASFAGKSEVPAARSSAPKSKIEIAKRAATPLARTVMREIIGALHTRGSSWLECRS